MILFDVLGGTYAQKGCQLSLNGNYITRLFSPCQGFFAFFPPMVFLAKQVNRIYNILWGSGNFFARDASEGQTNDERSTYG